MTEDYQIKNIFYLLSKNQEYLSVDQVNYMFSEIFKQKKNIQQFLNGKTKLSLSEFTTIFKQNQSIINQNIDDCFKILDTHQNGYIQMEQIKQLFAMFNNPKSQKQIVSYFFLTDLIKFAGFKQKIYLNDFRDLYKRISEI